MTLQEIADAINSIESRAKYIAELEKDGFNLSWRDKVRPSSNGRLMIPVCAIGNGYNYYGPYPKNLTIKPLDRELLLSIINNPNVEIVDCDSCCGCGDW